MRIQKPARGKVAATQVRSVPHAARRRAAAAEAAPGATVSPALAAAALAVAGWRASVGPSAATGPLSAATVGAGHRTARERLAERRDAPARRG